MVRCLFVSLFADCCLSRVGCRSLCVGCYLLSVVCCSLRGDC